MKRKLLLITGIMILYAMKVDCQNLPKIIPPSPTAQTFMRYGEIPVDFSTGVPNIDIPIYTLEGRQLKVPISISYHASGIKVNDIASEVGLGWALNTGGMVSRSVNGIQDEHKGPTRTFFNSEQLLDSVEAAAPIWDPSSWNLQGIMDFELFFRDHVNSPATEDFMNDRYFYKLPNGTSGVFTYDYNYMIDSIIILPYRPIKIEKYIGDGKIDEFKITDENGIVYIFHPYLVDAPLTCSEWFLDKMISADKTDTISYNYTVQTGHSSFPTVSFTYQGWVENPDINCHPTPNSSMSGSLSPVPEFNTPVLESIVSSQAVVKFEYASRNDFDYLKRLTKITITPVNSPTDTIKRAKFVPKYFGSTDANRRLGLDSVIIDVPGDTQPQVYRFSYESEELPPYPIKMTYPTYAYPTYSEDYWGYYNGSNSTSLIPVDFIADSYDKGYYGGNREADPTSNHSYSRACMLKEIKYPTGGRTAFEFERFYASNLYPYKSAGGYVGGFRVVSITNYSDSNAMANVKTYEYELPVTKQIGMEYFSYPQGFGYQSESCRAPYTRDMVSSISLLPLEVAPGMAVMYQKVIEYNGTAMSNAGKTVYTYDQPYSPCDFFNIPQHPLEFEGPIYYHPYHYDKGNYVPELLSRKVYSFDGTNYHPVAKDESVYSKLFTREFNTGIKLTRFRLYPSLEYFAGIMCGIITNPCQPLIDEYVQSIVAIDTKAYQEASLLTNSKNYVYDPLDSTKYVLTSTDYTYNESNLAIQNKLTLSSKGDTLKTFFKYPVDNEGTAVYDSMLNRNILSPSIEELSYKNSDFLRSTKTNYNFWNGTSWTSSGTNQILPQTVAAKTLTQATYDTLLRYHGYDSKGNVLSVSKENDQKLSYIWDYNQTYPVAQATNAAFNDIAYTSFEADGKGGWTYSGSTNSSYTITGKKSYLASGGNITRSGLTNTTYIVSYWGKGGYETVNSNNPTRIGKTIGDWTYYEYEVTGTSITISGSNYIDELRLYPKGAQMTTYTYTPLVGTTTACDATNKIIFYEYDSGNRLKLIKDEDGKILKRIDYKYKAGYGE